MSYRHGTLAKFNDADYGLDTLVRGSSRVCHRHIGPHINASILCRKHRALVLSHRTRRFPGLVVSIFLGLPGFRLVVFTSQCMTYFISLPSSTSKTCLNHLRLLSLIISSNICSDVLSVTSWLLTPSFHDMPSFRRCSLWCAVSNFFFCVTDGGHRLNRLQIKW